MMEKYSTPKGIEDLEAQLESFVMHALQAESLRDRPQAICTHELKIEEIKESSLHTCIT